MLGLSVLQLEMRIVNFRGISFLSPCFAVLWRENMDLYIEDYERDWAEKKLLVKLQEAKEAVKDNEDWLDLDELKALMEE